MKIVKTAYVKSYVSRDKIETHYPNQIAFSGRSNVGKSSILNSLLNRKNLAKTSSTPGKTRMVNVFSINDTIHFVDLPGFGYAKVSREMKQNWKNLVEGYLLDNPNLKGMVVIIDIRRGLQGEEGDLLLWLSAHHIPPVLVVNKTDKLSKQQISGRIKKIHEDLESMTGASEIPVISYSARTKTGKPLLWQEILRLVA